MGIFNLMLVVAGAVLTIVFCTSVIICTFLEIKKLIKKSADK